MLIKNLKYVQEIFYCRYFYILGPSGLRDHRTSTQHEFQMVGEVARSTEVTSQLGYLNRTPPGQEFPKAKNGQAGEIGWLYDTHKVVKGI